MKYICLLALLVVGIFSLDCTGGINQTACIGLTPKEDNKTEKCCWVKGTIPGTNETNTTLEICSEFSVKNYTQEVEDLKKEMPDAVVDCSSKYLYVVSLFALLFLL